VSGNNPGRPSKLTPALAEQMRVLVRAGVSIEAAAAAVGVTSRSVRNWRASGRLDLDREVAEVGAALNAAMARAATRSWRPAAWILEREFPERWAPQPRRARQSEP
jgi:hypothetical protein